MTMAKDDDDVLNQSEITYRNAKEFMKNLTKSIEDYLAFKDEMKKFIFEDKIKKQWYISLDLFSFLASSLFW